MNARAEQFWFLVRDAAVKRRKNHGAAGAALIIEKKLFNKYSFPLLRNLRELSKVLAKQGYRNGKGAEYHYDQLRVDIFKALTDLTFEVRKVKPTKSQWNALYGAIVDGCMQRKHRDKLSEEDECRMSWRGNPLLKKPMKRENPWDQYLEPDEQDDAEPDEQDEDEAA